MTWHRDSHGLFDFEANLYKKQLMVVKGTGVLGRDSRDENIQYYRAGIIKDMGDEPLSTIVYSQGQYFVYH
jgi:hypothetical protein